MINVGFDKQIFLLQKHGGIRSYFTNLINIFANDASYGIKPILLFPKSKKINLFDNDGSSIGNVKYKDKITISLNRKDISLIHNTYYLPLVHNLYPNIKKITTIHDMIPEVIDSNNFLYNSHFAKKTYFKKSDAIIAVSDSTLRDLRTIYGDTNKLIKRIYHGVDHSKFFPIKNLQKQSYLLYVGKRNSYKNGELAIRAIEFLPKEIKLICVGGGKFTKKELDLIASKNLTERVRQVSASELTLANLYREATALIITSQIEGFGLPALEAMASGCPVLAAASTCMKEICGDSAAFFKPNLIDDLVYKIEKILGNSDFSQLLHNKGLLHAAGFSWEECARKTAELYHEIV